MLRDSLAWPKYECIGFHTAAANYSLDHCRGLLLNHHKKKGARRTFFAAAGAILITPVIARQANNLCKVLSSDMLILLCNPRISNCGAIGQHVPDHQDI